jgi:hypothetical protein
MIPATAQKQQTFSLDSSASVSSSLFVPLALKNSIYYSSERLSNTCQLSGSKHHTHINTHFLTYMHIQDEVWNTKAN